MKKCVTILCLSVVALFAFAACTPSTNGSGQAVQPVQEDVDGVFHQFDNLGFSVVFPEFWEGKYGTEELSTEVDSGIAHFVSLYHIATRQEIGEGRLLTLGRAVGEYRTYDDDELFMLNGLILSQTGGYTYFATFPTDVQHNFSDPSSGSSAEYLEMVGHWEPSHWDFLVDSFRLID